MKKINFAPLAPLVTLALLLFANQALASNNPFSKKLTMDVGPESMWVPTENSLTRTGRASDGKYYSLSVGANFLKLYITFDAERKKPISVDGLEVRSMKLDGETLPVYKWCLGNQNKRRDALKQGLRVKKGICRINNKTGEFTVTLNAQTRAKIAAGDELSITIKPYRAEVVTMFYIGDLISKSAPTRTTGDVPPGMVTPISTQKIISKKCAAKQPGGYPSIKPVIYACADTSAKNNAYKKIKTRVKKVDAARSIASLKSSVAKAEAEKRRIAKTEQTKLKSLNNIGRKMVKNCKAKWKVGESRCYCEKYLDFAPIGVNPDPSCKK